MRKSKTKKSVSVLLVLMAIIMLLTSCGKTETKTTEPAADGTEADAAVATDAAAETDTAAETDGADETDGETPAEIRLKLAAWHR